MVKLKILTILLIISVLACNLTFGQRDKELFYGGLHGGTYNLGEGWEGYFGGAMVTYHNQSAYRQPQFFGNWGLIASAAYFSGPEADISLAVQLSKGIWFDETSLLQYGLGPSLSNFNGLGISGIVLASHLFPLFTSEVNSGAVFLQGDHYQNSGVGGAEWRFTLGVSFGVGGIY